MTDLMMSSNQASPSRNLPHRRLNPLNGSWVLVSPHRTQRPWQGKVEDLPPENRPSYDPGCYLCPGNQRAGGHANPQYTSTFVFTNDFAALLPQDGDVATGQSPLFMSESAQGTCRVICFSPRHDLTLPRMALGDIRKVIDIWIEQVLELEKQYRWVQIFENKGEIMGCSNPHPHGQIWASNFLPHEIAQEDECQKQYLKRHRRVLLEDYTEQEIEQAVRVVAQNDSWLVVVPFWALWPFETLLLPRRPVKTLPGLQEKEKSDLAEILKNLLTRYDNLFGISFPYSMGWHAAPAGSDQDHWQLHAHFYPPLLRSATVKKFMVGYEMLAEPQRDLTPELAAERLRNSPDVFAV